MPGEEHPLSKSKKKFSNFEEILDDIKDAKDAWRTKYLEKTALEKSHNYIDGIEDNNDVHPSQRADRIQENTLHKFATYNTIFTISGLSKNEIEDVSFLKNPVHDIIARTGGIGDPNISWGRYDEETNEIRAQVRESFRNPAVKGIKTHEYDNSVNILAKGHDIFFENLNIVSTVGPNPERGLANFTKMDFEMHEPFGVTLVEKLRGSAFVNGWTDYQDAPFLLTMEWKGTDENGKVIGNTGPGAGMHSQGLLRKIPIYISRVQFEVDQGGARYTAVAVPYGDMGHDDRFKYPRKAVKVSASNLSDKIHAEPISKGPPRSNMSGFGGGRKYDWDNFTTREKRGTWVYQVEKVLFTQMEDEKREKVRELNDVYRFQIADEIIKFGDTYFAPLQTTRTEETAAWHNFFRGEGPPKAIINTAEGGIDFRGSLPKFFEDAIRSLVGYQWLVDAFWYTYGANKLTDKAGGSPVTDRDQILRYLKDKEQFKADLEADQYIDWFMIKSNVVPDPSRFDKIRKVHPKTITYYAIPTKLHILKFIKPGISFGNVNWDKYVRKQYDYIYTGDNVDVQNLKIDYKAAYFFRNVRPIYETETGKGSWQEFSEDFEKSVEEVFGAEDYPEPKLPYRQEPSLIKGSNTVSTIAGERSQEFYDYITNPQTDMMKIELEILGDPAYICQDMYTPLSKDGKYWAPSVYNKTYGCFNVEQYQPLIKVNYRLPDEPEEREAVMFQKQLSYSESLFFNGVYQVTRVDSQFQNGEFKQILTCVRLNNQTGEGTTGEIVKKGEYQTIWKEHFDEIDDIKAKEKANETKKCFHPEQLFGDKCMKDIQPGDIINGQEILGMIKLKLTEDMYSISDVKVTGSHGMKYKDKWIFVKDHPDSIKIDDKPEFVYIPLVEGGTFIINNEEFADYDYHDMVGLGDKVVEGVIE